jgi:hypothetical protein
MSFGIFLFRHIDKFTCRRSLAVKWNVLEPNVYFFKVPYCFTVFGWPSSPA